MNPNLTVFRKFIPSIVVFVLLLSTCSKQQSSSQPTPTPLPAPIIPIKPTYTVERGQVISKLEFTGKIMPVVMQELFFRAAGRVNTISVSTAEQVKAGQILAQIDTSPSPYDLRRAQANLDIAKLNRELASLQNLTDSDVYSITLAIKDREVELAQIALDELNDAVAAGQIISPIDGTILSISMAEGNTVEPFKPVMVVADLSNLEVSADLRVDELEEVIQDAKVLVHADTRNASDAQGTVKTLPLNPGPTGGNIRITLEKPPSELGYKVGDTVRLTIILEQKEDALWLPPQAVRNFDGRRFVIVQEPNGQRRVDVKVGIDSGERVEILEGLNEGDVVVAP